jgi:hypothetical protein
MNRMRSASVILTHLRYIVMFRQSVMGRMLLCDGMALTWPGLRALAALRDIAALIDPDTRGCDVPD